MSSLTTCTKPDSPELFLPLFVTWTRSKDSTNGCWVLDFECDIERCDTCNTFAKDRRYTYNRSHLYYFGLVLSLSIIIINFLKNFERNLSFHRTRTSMLVVMLQNLFACRLWESLQIGNPFKNFATEIGSCSSTLNNSNSEFNNLELEYTVCPI